MKKHTIKAEFFLNDNRLEIKENGLVKPFKEASVDALTLLRKRHDAENLLKIENEEILDPVEQLRRFAYKKTLKSQPLNFKLY